MSVIPSSSPRSGRSTYCWGSQEKWCAISFKDLQVGDLFCQQKPTGDWHNQHGSIVMLAVSSPFEVQLGAEKMHTIFSTPCPFDREGFDLNEFLDRRLEPATE